MIQQKMKFTVEQSNDGVAIIMNDKAIVVHWQDALAMSNIIKKHALQARERLNPVKIVASSGG